jgi:hypothetical protein
MQTAARDTALPFGVVTVAEQSHGTALGLVVLLYMASFCTYLLLVLSVKTSSIAVVS